MLKHHVFVCSNKRPPGHPKGSCGERGCGDVLLALQDALEADEDLLESVKLNTTNCLGPCRAGPTMVVYPAGVWYGGVTPADVPELVRSHFVEGVPLARLVLQDV